MPDGDDGARATVRLADSLATVSPAAWDGCAGTTDPFLSHAFLSAMEESGAVRPRTGWLPQHLLVEDDDGRLVGAVPLYLKGHSHGEYVFDWGWADAYERAGGSYYPKLLSTVPFTPATGSRLLIRPGAEASRIAEILGGGLLELTRQHKVSSLHVIFPRRQEWELLGEMGFLQRLGLQYHWQNDGYASFEAFLAALSSRKRKQIRKERREAAGHGIAVHMLTGAAIEPRHWEAFFAFYMDTADRKWGSPYLNRRFFALLGQRLADRVLLVMAEHEGRLVAGALNLIGSDTLYGRNWGCIADFKFLHFELCYYRAIDFAIANGLQRVEAGAQGPHKIQRGYRATYTYSAHHIPSRGFRRAVEEFLQRERAHLAREKAELDTLSPFRKA